MLTKDLFLRRISLRFYANVSKFSWKHAVLTHKTPDEQRKIPWSSTTDIGQYRIFSPTSRALMGTFFRSESHEWHHQSRRFISNATRIWSSTAATFNYIFPTQSAGPYGRNYTRQSSNGYDNVTIEVSKGHKCKNTFCCTAVFKSGE